jgi:hypothetical protein
VSVQCVINCTTHTLIWELMPLASNEDWLTYLQNASHWQWPLVLLISVHQNPLINIEAAPGDENIDEEVEERNIEAGGTAAPQCVVDEGGTYPSLLNSYKTKNVNWTKQ